MPLNWIVLKIVETCNLNCTYCYVYNRGDDSWRTRPKFISDEVVELLGTRIRQHSAKYALSTFVIELHGGEPLLFGITRMRSLVERIRSLCVGVSVKFILQTNGVLLSETWLTTFQELGIRFGISLDGSPEIADEFRVFHNGKGSTQAVLDTIGQLRASSGLFEELMTGILCVVNPKASGKDTVRWFTAQGFSAVDFLLPDGNLANLPANWNGPEGYRRFMIDAFKEWYALDTKAPRIRFFEMMMMGLMGRKPQLDALGGDLRTICVVESDGSIGISDVLRICGSDFAQDALNLATDSLDRHAERYEIDRLQALPSKCGNCEYLDACNGGYLPHRFDGMTFDNPSLYCRALYDLSAEMMQALRRDLPPDLFVNKNPARVSYPTAI